MLIALLQSRADGNPPALYSECGAKGNLFGVFPGIHGLFLVISRDKACIICKNAIRHLSLLRFSGGQ
ncbi:MAG: hypothetical protein FWD77_06800 [Betaproteobacteria bacterium]|nr:hypothetical protein [Betaproteobacteria bacterium]